MNEKEIKVTGMPHYYSLRNDYMFRVVMQKSQNTLKALVCSILGLERDELTSCELLNPIIMTICWI